MNFGEPRVSPAGASHRVQRWGLGAVPRHGFCNDFRQMDMIRWRRARAADDDILAAMAAGFVRVDVPEHERVHVAQVPPVDVRRLSRQVLDEMDGLLVI